MKKIVSIALFGDVDRKDGSGQNYHAYLSTFMLAHHNLFSCEDGWELHVHVDDLTFNGSRGPMLSRLQSMGLINLTLMSDAILTRAMLWRMAPIYRDDTDYVFCRDIDSLPMPRDRRVCDEFIVSKCVVHTVHDSQSHAGIMGGLCGFQSTAFKNTTGIHSLQALYDYARVSNDEWALHGTDQNVLNRLIDQPSGLTLLEHRYNGWHAGPGKYPIRGKGSYRCKSWSCPTPDKGTWKGEWAQKDWLLDGKVGTFREHADLLANHLGSAGYDIEKARMFWNQYGDQKVARIVADCEK